MVVNGDMLSTDMLSTDGLRRKRINEWAGALCAVCAAEAASPCSEIRCTFPPVAALGPLRSLQYEHSVAKAIEAVALADGLLVGAVNEVFAGEGCH